MILYLAIFVLISYGFLAHKFGKGSPMTLYSLVWGGIIFAYQMKLFNVFVVDENTEICIFLSVCFWGIGYFCVSNKKVAASTNGIQEFSFRGLYLIIILMILSSFMFYIAQINIFINSGFKFSEVKKVLITQEIIGDGVLMQYFVRPFELLVAIIAIYCVFYRRKERFIILYAVVDMLLRFLSTGSKSFLAFYGVCIAGILINTEGISRVLKKIKRKAAILIIGLGSGIAIALVQVGNVLESLYFYLCGCIPVLDKVINGAFYIYKGNTYGFLSFNGLWRVIVKVSELTGLSLEWEKFELAESYISRYEYTTMVSPTHYYNGFTTYISNFYSDFGVLGIIVLSFMFGAGSAYIYVGYKKKSNMCYLILLVLDYYFIAFSMVRFQLANTIYAMAVLYTIIIVNYLSKKHRRVTIRRRR